MREKDAAQLVDEGILLLRGPGRRRVVARVDACDSPTCECRNVTVQLTTIRPHATRLRIENHEFFASVPAGAREPFDEETTRTVLVDVDSSEILDLDENPVDFEADARLHWLRDALDGSLLDAFAHRVAGVRKPRRNGETREVRRRGRGYLRRAARRAVFEAALASASLRR
jgi:hypothetical protein